MSENDERPPGGGERAEPRPDQRSGGGERTEPMVDLPASAVQPAEPMVDLQAGTGQPVDPILDPPPGTAQPTVPILVPQAGAVQPVEPGPGRMRFQDETTTPREPTLAERRAREQAEKREWEAEKQRIVDEEAARKKRKRILIGTGVTVGVVALIAIGYAASQPSEEVVAHCTDPDGVIVDDTNCLTPASDSSSYNGGGGYYGGGFFPIFIGGGGRQYHYNYGGSGDIGQRVTGGTTTVPPESSSVRSGSSGKSISRGGLGVSSSGSSSGS